MFGRAVEREELLQILEAARDRGAGTAVAILGEPGIGKTTLCSVARDAASGFTVLSARGVESEAQFAFSGLGDVLTPLHSQFDQLVPQQAAALGAALALGPPVAASPLMLGAATLSALTVPATRAPVLVIVDDAHWLDEPSMSALLFAARRIRHDAVVMIFCARPEEGGNWDYSGLQRITLTGLDPGAARQLLCEATGIDPHPDVLSQLVERTAGNPLALRELAGQVGAGALAARTILPEDDFVRGSIVDAFGRRLSRLPARCRRALSVLAASPDERVHTIAAALDWLGFELADLAPAEDAGLVVVETEAVRFVHPLLRSAASVAMKPSQRREIHQALATAYPPGSDEQVRHRAAAAVAPDEELAAALAVSAARAAFLGAMSVAADAAQRAAQLTPPGRERSARLVQAAGLLLVTGRANEVPAYLEEARALVSDPALVAEIQFLHAQLDSYYGSPNEAVNEMVAAARLAAASNPDRAAAMLAFAGFPALLARGDARLALELTHEAESLVTDRQSPAAILCRSVRAHALLTDGDFAAALPLLDEAALSKHWRKLAPGQVMAPTPASGLAWTEQYDRARDVIDDAIEHAREQGAAGDLVFDLGVRASIQCFLGEWAAAVASCTESAQLGAELHQPVMRAWGLAWLAWLAAARGNEAECRTASDEMFAIRRQFRNDSIEAYARSALGLLAIGQGRWAEALVELERVDAFVHEWPRTRGYVTPEVRFPGDLIETLIRLQRFDRAREVLGEIEADAERTARIWLRAAALHGRALMSPDDEADAAYGLAHEWAGKSPMPFQRARIELDWGTFLRRQHRHHDAREILLPATATFGELGAAPWYTRATHELLALGHRLQKRTTPGLAGMTPQEYQVAATVAAGATNKEAAAALFLSVKTIEFHLSAVYRKLGVTSRSQLARTFASPHHVASLHEPGDPGRPR